MLHVGSFGWMGSLDGWGWGMGLGRGAGAMGVRGGGGLLCGPFLRRGHARGLVSSLFPFHEHTRPCLPTACHASGHNHRSCDGTHTCRQHTAAPHPRHATHRWKWYMYIDFARCVGPDMGDTCMWRVRVPIRAGQLGRLQKAVRASHSKAGPAVAASIHRSDRPGTKTTTRRFT